jgi:plasminogen activator
MSKFLIYLFAALCLNMTYQNLECETILPEILLPEIIHPLRLPPGGMQTLNSDSENFSIYLHSGYMTGQGNEYVLMGDYKLSHLIWDIDSLYLIGGGIEWKTDNYYTVTADIWLKTSDGKAMMNDYDWLLEGYEWTHWSHHDNTTVTKANIFDIYISYTPKKFRNSLIKFNTLFGYKRSNFEWEARGGSYIYSDDFFRDTEGIFPDNELGITYEQIFNTPYTGFEIELPLGRFIFESKITGSFAVFGKAIDHHHLRDLVTTANFYWGHMIFAEAGAGFNFSKRFAMKGSYSYNRYGGLRGDSKYNQSGSITIYKDLEAADFESFLLSVSLFHSF